MSDKDQNGWASAESLGYETRYHSSEDLIYPIGNIEIRSSKPINQPSDEDSPDAEQLVDALEGRVVRRIEKIVGVLTNDDRRLNALEESHQTLEYTFETQLRKVMSRNAVDGVLREVNRFCQSVFESRKKNQSKEGE